MQPQILASIFQGKQGLLQLSTVKYWIIPAAKPQEELLVIFQGHVVEPATHIYIIFVSYKVMQFCIQNSKLTVS